MIFTNAQDVISYLYTLPKLHKKADLSYIKRVLAALGKPQDKVKTIHVTGTNGKGSTCYYLSNLLQKAGQKTGLFVSPYVFAFGERIQLDGQNISDADLVAVANQVEEVLNELRQELPSFSLVTFEYEVVMAFVYFAQKKCDYAIIEVGIGGEHDKTNVITPEVSVITTVDLDHEDLIGPTIQDIAREKSGVIKQQRPVILGNVPQVVLPILEQKARASQAPVFLLARDFTITGKTQLTYQDMQEKLTFTIRPQVEGYDVAVAVRAFKTLQLTLTNAEIEQAINQTVIPGRYQILQEQPLIVLDGAHNIQAMKNLLNFVHQQQKLRQGKVRVLITMMKDKDLTEVFSLFKSTDQVELTTIAYPRAAKKEDFPRQVQQKYPYQSNCQIGFEQLQKVSQANDILLVTGSFYLVGEILQMEAVDACSRH
ncbi:bifunctional folylpolyglutamate synthase/dihydrofolate synthase [Lactobacillus sp. ESL0785]|uniref:bifunctional folylpolyglutamate synthase/dihydrofolate synthase n=1 Tax=Lactobacillus sp. ESL0785 TaxID=2983232 RepID=UPI0023F85734|nr:folylpolyglutamate synthase/dihydrofolate synthase family protein [Lactobacillus sp. ESL0785]WEV71506.1 bifunctional folylpolyglutamate synthase/dihydrofolate synthase [Lactobacillus sp. ESL0785]